MLINLLLLKNPFTDGSLFDDPNISSDPDLDLDISYDINYATH